MTHFKVTVLTLLSVVASTVQAAELVPTNAVWRLFKGRTEASLPDVAAWRTLSFDDSGFTNAQAPFTYGEGYTYGTVLSDMLNQYTCIFLRRTFDLTNLDEIGALQLGAKVDDGFVAWINGVEVQRVNMPTAAGSAVTITNLANNASEPVPFTFYDLLSPTNYLGIGTNVLAVQVFNTSAGSSDLVFDCSLESILRETNPPVIVSIDPPPGVVTQLTQITVTFSEPVSGVEPGDLFLNGIPLSLGSGSGTTYTFSFAQPLYGLVSLTWVANHGIADLAFPPNPFDATAPDATWQYDLVDQTLPTVVNVFPPATVTVRALSQVEVAFSEPVIGIDASDLRVNGLPATNLIGRPGSIYLFQFPEPATGAVQVAWADGHAITDQALVPNPFLGVPWGYVLDPNAPPPDLMITEIAAANQAGLADEDGEAVDWIEIYNRGGSAVNLAGWALSDDPDLPDQWVFPSRMLNTGEFLVVFASGKDRRPAGTNSLHTNFELGTGGEFLGLYSPDAPRVLISGFSPQFPEQRNDVSYGVDPHGDLRYLATPTPGAPNGESTITGLVAPVHFSVSRGLFTQPFTLTLSTPTAGATIRYTTDGSEPTLANGVNYFGPLRITTTTLLRAAAFRTNLLPSLIGTHSYLFGLSAAHRSLPVMSLVTATNNLIGRTGITGMGGGSRASDNLYITNNPATDFHNPSMHGIAWERPVSAEYIRPEDNDGFQIDCGIRVQGSDYARPRTLPGSKFSFRLYFRGDYGPGRLEYPLFPLTSVQSFDQIVLRAGMNDPSNPFIRDELARRLSHDMNQVAAHGTLVNLFINGEYRGYYNPTERVHEEFLQSHLGGSDEWDVVSPTWAIGSGQPGVVDGDRADFQNLVSYVNNQAVADAGIYEQVGRRLDLTNFVDYLLVNVYCAMGDWPANNFRAGRDRTSGTPGSPWRFIVWDGEWMMGYNSRAVTRNTFTEAGPGPDDSGLATMSSEIAQLYQRLSLNPEFRLLWADRVHKHMFNGGPLTDTNITARFNQLKNQMAVVLPGMTDIITPWVPQRRGIIFGHFNQYGLMASTNAPFFNQHGGRVTRGFALTMAATNVGGTVYFTTNGNDPRVKYTGAIASDAAAYTGPISLGQSMTVRARTLNGTNWSALAEASFEVAILGLPLRITELNYNPVGNPAYEFLELLNVGSATLDLSGMSFEGITFTFIEGAALAPGARLVLASNDDPSAFTNRYPGVVVAGWYTGALNNGGERITLLDKYGTVITSVTFDDAGGWPLAADGGGASLEVIDPLGDPNDPANWWASAEPGGTPGAAPAPLPLPDVRFNEVMAENVSAVNHHGTFPDWVELFNAGGSDVDLAGWSLTDDGDPRKFIFPAGSTLPGGGYLIVWCDAVTNTTPGLHTGFELGRNGDSVFLFDADTNLIEAISFGLQVADYSVGRVGAEWVLTTPTTNAENAAAIVGSVTNVTINEWLANPVPGQPDWIELFNNSSHTPVALRGLYLATSNAVHQITSLSFIAPASFALLYADEGIGPDHLGFRLPAAGGTLALHDPLAVELERLTYTAQTEGVSRGRLPDGSTNVVHFVGTASPNASNYTTNYTGPVLNEVLARNQSAVTNGGNTPDFVEIYNPNATAWNLDGMSLSVDAAAPGQWIFPPGTTLSGRSFLVVWCDGSRPASTNAGRFNTGRWLDGESGGAYLFNLAGQLVNSVEYGFQVADRSIGLSSNQWRLLATPTPGASNTPPSALGTNTMLRINEWMAYPASGPDWFELFNPTNVPVDLSRLILTGDPSISGTNQFRVSPLSFIGPQGFVKWVADGNAGQGRNHVNFQLAAQGESILLYNAAGTVVLDSVFFGAQWLGVSEGRLPDGGARIVSFPGSPTPGEVNRTLLAGIVINEVLSHAGPGQENAVELQNLTGEAIALGGWYLSDSQGTPTKYRMPDGTSIPAGGFLLIYETQFNSGGAGGFALSPAYGGEVWLSEADATGALTGNRTGAKFGPAAPGVSFGRHLTRLGVDYVAMNQRTLGATNAGPLVGPVVLNEIMYHPPLGWDSADEPEYIELLNVTGDAVALFDPAAPTNTWRLGGAVEFAFPPTNVTLAAGSLLLVVDFDPVVELARLVDLRGRYGIPATVPIFGPYAGKLDNAGETVDLLKPDSPLPSGYVPFVRVERVSYSDDSPWPASAVDGGGLSLQRRESAEFGNDPENWMASAPTPGLPNGAPVVTLPVITRSPQDQTAVPGNPVSFNVEASSASPLSYQWRFDGMDLPDATNAALWLDWVDLEDDGFYDVVVANAGGVIFSDPAYLQVDAAPMILDAPQGRNVPPSTNVLFSVLARGSAPMSYQWRFNGADIPGATSTSLLLTNVGLGQMGNYTVAVSNRVAVVETPPAFLGVLVKATILQQPQNQTALVGQDVSFSVLASGAAPMSFRWRRNSVNFTNGMGCLILSSDTNSTLIVSNVNYLHDGDRMNVVIQNIAAGTTLSGATNGILRVLSAPVVTLEPTNAVVNAGANATFRAIFRANPAGIHEWWFNETNLLAWGTNSLSQNTFTNSLTLTNAHLAHEGTYTLAVSNEYGWTRSTNAVLTIRKHPVIIVSPQSQAVLAGSPVTFSVVVTGTPPFRHSWKFNGTNLPVAIGTNTVLTLTNVQAGHVGDYWVVVTNLAGSATSLVAQLTLALDSDGDGMPDDWEDAHGLNKNDPADASLDSDGDGMSNLAEYTAATDPNDPQSYLRLEVDTVVPGGIALRFNAVSNKTYTVQFTDDLTSLQWQKLADVPAQPADRTEVLLDPNPGSSRYYRLATPMQR